MPVQEGEDSRWLRWLPAQLGRRSRLPLLRYGSHGEAVAQLQQALSTAGFDPGPVDGHYGLLTEAAVRELQQEAGLWPDGRSGPQVWEVLADPYWSRTRQLIQLKAGQSLEMLGVACQADARTVARWNGLATPASVQTGDRLFVRLTYRLGVPAVGWLSAAASTRQAVEVAAPYLSGVACWVLDTLGPAGLPPVREWDGWADQAESSGLERWGVVCLQPPAAFDQPPEPRQTGFAQWIEQLVGMRAAGILWDLRPWRLPDQMPALRLLLEATRDALTIKGGSQGSPPLAAWLPLPVRSTPSFRTVWEQVTASLRKQADFLWLSAWRRPVDWLRAPRPLALAELEGWLTLALTTWRPWRVGLVLPVSGWRLESRPSPLPPSSSAGDSALDPAVWPLTRMESLRLGRRLRSTASRLGSAPDWERDVDSGLLTRADRSVYLVDQYSWSCWLELVERRRLGGIAVYGLGQENPRWWPLLAQHSGRIPPYFQASPDGTGISI